MRRLGVDPEKDAKIIPAGGTAERFAALSKGVTHFTLCPSRLCAGAKTRL